MNKYSLIISLVLIVLVTWLGYIGWITKADLIYLYEITINAIGSMLPSI